MTATVYYKATRTDGTDFYTGTMNYAAAVGGTIDVGRASRKLPPACCDASVLHAATVPTATLVGGWWPCRLFEVTGRPVAEEGHKRGFRSLRVVGEVDAHLALGPQGREVAALVDRAGRLTAVEVGQLGAARAAARAAARGAAWGAAGGAARGAARDAAGALIVRDLIGRHHFTQTHYNTLTHPWATVIGPPHPHDKAANK
jgi:hypothetical protein